jgi:hypothetical protein
MYKIMANVSEFAIKKNCLHLPLVSDGGCGILGIGSIRAAMLHVINPEKVNRNTFRYISLICLHVVLE